MEDFKPLSQKEMQNTEGGWVLMAIAVAIAILATITAPPPPPEY
jgi:lactobin A/cerein 7B family class IIb bacteriocin